MAAAHVHTVSGRHLSGYHVSSCAASTDRTPSQASDQRAVGVSDRRTPATRRGGVVANAGFTARRHGINVNNFGLIPAARLDWIGKAIGRGSARASANRRPDKQIAQKPDGVRLLRHARRQKRQRTFMRVRVRHGNDVEPVGNEPRPVWHK